MMKRNTTNSLLRILMLALIVFSWTSCHKDKDPEDREPRVSNVEVTPAATSASFSWIVEFTGQFQTGVELSEYENMTELRRVEATKQQDKYVVTVENLSAAKKYYYRIVTWNKFNSFEEEVETFTTEPQTPTQDTTYYTISLSCQPEEGGTIGGGGTFAEGDTCTITAVANAGYTFVNWTENGSQVSADLEYKFAVTANRSLMANFSSEDYIISVVIDPESGGTVTGAGGYNYGDECTLTAAANEGYDFTNWTKNGEEVSTNTTYTFTVTESAEYVAHFQIQSYTITVAADPENGGTVEGGGTYEYGQTCTVKATEANGYHFVNWTENDGQVSANEEYTFTITDNRDLMANFSAEDYIISVEIEPENSGTVTGAGGYNYGAECTLTATPNEGFDFAKWTKNGTQVSTGPSFSFTVTESASYTARFTPKSFTISVSAEPSNGGNVTGGGDYHYGEECTLTATANTGYTFDHWTKNGSQISDGATISFNVTESATYLAYFNEQPQVPTGAINGLFTINDNGDQVYFSQGNLQYIGSADTPYWKFADHQWDFLGSSTNQNSTNQNVNRDLFGWGTSGYNHGAYCYQPWSTSNYSFSYYAYGQSTYNLYDQTGQADWGYNAISNGGNTTNNWRTLTVQEWEFVFNTRSAFSVNGTPNARYAKAKVANVQGVILFPDQYTHPSVVALPLGINETGNTGWNENNYSETDFAAMENAGAVFLPAAGYREEISLNGVSVYGYYWSASPLYYSAYCLHFLSSDLLPSNSNKRHYGLSVRLVTPAEN